MTNNQDKCCPNCNFKGIAFDGPVMAAFGEEYCGKPDCDCHKSEGEKHDPNLFQQKNYLVSQKDVANQPPPAQEEGLKELLPGAPELQIAMLVRRAHSSSECPHKGNCLTEREMIEQLSDYLRSLLSSDRKKLIEEVEKLKEPTRSPNGLIMPVKQYNTALDSVLEILRKDR